MGPAACRWRLRVARDPGVARTSTVISLEEAISYRPHALLRAAAGSWDPPARSQAPHL